MTGNQKQRTSPPGRVNLLGEHTDYNGGYVLPFALKDMGVSIAMSKGDKPGIIEAYSDTFDNSDTRQISEEKNGSWSDYVLGCLKVIAEKEIAQSGLKLAVATTLPMGAGLSSSAALEVASLKAAAELFGKELSPVEAAIKAQEVENNFVGMPCGIMDQFASSVGAPGSVMFLDTRTLKYEVAPSPEGHNFVIVHSGVSHQLTEDEDGYATRVKQCNAACNALNVELLSDLGLDDLDKINALPAPLDRRARHVITDNARAAQGVAALNSGEVKTFGRLMTESHISEKDDYEITVPETDSLVEAALKAKALGARQTGGGWGGSIVALLKSEDVEQYCQMIERDFSKCRVLAIS